MNFLLRSLLLPGIGASAVLLAGCYPSYPSGYGYGGYSRPYYSRPYYGGGGGYYYSRYRHDHHDHHDHHNYGGHRYYGKPANQGGNKPKKVSSSNPGNRRVNPSTGGYANPRMQAAYQARTANRNRSSGGGGGNNKKKKN